MRAEAENPRARVFVIFLDTGHTELAGSHRMQRSLVSMLDQMLAPDDLFAVMTPQMSPSDLAFARKTETVEGYLRRYWTWGERDRLMPDRSDRAALCRVLPRAARATDQRLWRRS